MPFQGVIGKSVKLSKQIRQVRNIYILVDVDFEIVASGNLELEITIWVVLKNVEHE
jgi:disulfide oxidoreductase YuzD